MRTTQLTLAVFTVAAVAAVAVACAEAKPDKLAMDPSGPFKFEKKGESEDVKLAAFVGTQPYVKAVAATWKSSDESVATVDDKGHIVATGSGTAVITASAWGIEAKGDVQSTIVGSVAIADDVPKPFRLKNKGVQLHVTVKDDKGKVIEKPLVAYRATDYCVEVDDNGFLKPMAEGDCAIEIRSADKYAKLNVSVKE